VGALAEMYIQGVSTRKVKAITEELCGHEFSASAISAINKRLDEELHRFKHRSLEEEFPYLILDARYEKVREEGVIRSRAVLVALGVDWEGRRQVLAVELANRESTTSWKEFLLKLKSRGLRSVQRRGGPPGSGRLARQVPSEVSQAMLVGGRQYRGNLHFLPAPQGTS
jgi:putative transposase